MSRISESPDRNSSPLPSQSAGVAQSVRAAESCATDGHAAASPLAAVGEAPARHHRSDRRAGGPRHISNVLSSWLDELASPSPNGNDPDKTGPLPVGTVEATSHLGRTRWWGHCDLCNEDVNFLGLLPGTDLKVCAECYEDWRAGRTTVRERRPTEGKSREV